jgi:hypothetical protein
MPTLTLPFPAFVNGTLADGAQVTQDFTATTNVVNGIDFANIGAAGIYANQIIPGSTFQAIFGGSFGYTFKPGGAGVVPLTITGAAGQTADLFDVFAGATKLASIDSGGNLSCKNATVANLTANVATVSSISSTTGLQVQGTISGNTTAFGNTGALVLQATAPTGAVFIQPGALIASGKASFVDATGFNAADASGNVNVYGPVNASVKGTITAGPGPADAGCALYVGTPNAQNGDAIHLGSTATEGRTAIGTSALQVAGVAGTILNVYAQGGERLTLDGFGNVGISSGFYGKYLQTQPATDGTQFLMQCMPAVGANPLFGVYEYDATHAQAVVNRGGVNGFLLPAVLANSTQVNSGIHVVCGQVTATTTSTTVTYTGAAAPFTINPAAFVFDVTAGSMAPAPVTSNPTSLVFPSVATHLYTYFCFGW